MGVKDDVMGRALAAMVENLATVEGTTRNWGRSFHIRVTIVELQWQVDITNQYLKICSHVKLHQAYRPAENPIWGNLMSTSGLDVGSVSRGRIGCLMN